MLTVDSYELPSTRNNQSQIQQNVQVRNKIKFQKWVVKILRRLQATEKSKTRENKQLLDFDDADEDKDDDE